MSNIPTYFADAAAPTAEEPLSPWVKAFAIIGLSLAAWLPVLLPLYLIFYR